jgi:UDP-glucose 4-epimerase
LDKYVQNEGEGLMLYRVVVTGGAGFIGSSLVTALMQSRDHEVVVLDNLSTGDLRNISYWTDHPNFKFLRADLLDPFSIRKIIDSSDIIFHLAANPEVSLGSTNTKTDYEQNILCTYNILEAMRNSRTCKKIIFPSTSTVYGEADVMPTSENYSPLKPISLYGATKLACEALISGYCHMFNISCVTARLANVVGSMNNRGVIHDFIDKLNKNSSVLEVLGDGTQTKSYLYIDDCISALMLLVSKLEDSTFEIFNVGPGDTINVLDVAKTVIQGLSLNSVRFQFTNNFEGRGWKGDVKKYWLDSSKLEALGWKPKCCSKEAVSRTVEDYVNNQIQVRSGGS